MADQLLQEVIRVLTERQQLINFEITTTEEERYLKWRKIYAIYTYSYIARIYLNICVSLSCFNRDCLIDAEDL